MGPADERKGPADEENAPPACLQRAAWTFTCFGLGRVEPSLPLSPSLARRARNLMSDTRACVVPVVEVQVLGSSGFKGCLPLSPREARERGERRQVTSPSSERGTAGYEPFERESERNQVTSPSSGVGLEHLRAEPAGKRARAGGRRAGRCRVEGVGFMV